MLSRIECAQPKGTTWLILGCPILFISVIAFLKFDAFDPTVPITGEVMDLWFVLLVVLAAMLLPLWRVPRTVAVDEDGAIVRFFTGRRRRIAWSEIVDIALLSAADGPLGSTELLRIKPQRGQIVQVTDRMSNFPQFKSFVCKSWTGPLRLQPNNFERLFLNAKQRQTR